DEQAGPIAALLERRIADAAADRDRAGDPTRELLDRLILATSGLAAVNDAARELRYLYYDRVVLDASRRRVLDEAGAHLAALATGPPRLEHLVAVADSPHPLLGYLSAHIPGATPPLRRAMAAILLARYYRVPVAEVEMLEAPVPLATGDHYFDGQRIRAIV